MPAIPVTSVSLLKAIAADSGSVRWTEFYARYAEPMRAFLAARFPSLEADDVIQEAMLALMRKLPDYRYVPDARGHFRNYLTGIVKHKAMDALARRSHEADVRDRLRDAPAGRPDADEDAAWRLSAMEVAIAQLLADETVPARNREIFRHVALDHEPPERVAADFGVTRNNVDQIKSRMIARLAARVTELTRDDPK